MTGHSRKWILLVGRANRRKRRVAAAFGSIRSNPAYLALLLGSFSLVSALLLSSTHMATEAAIDQRLKEDLQASLAMVLPPQMHDNDPVEDSFILDGGDSEGDPGRRIYPAIREGEVRAVAYQTRGLGYGGEMLILIGVDSQGVLLGVRVLQHAETPGLGDKIEIARDDWIRSFDGLSLTNLLPSKWTVKKEGGHFDQFSGATITPRAVVKSVHKALDYFVTHQVRLLSHHAKDEKDQ